MYQALSQAPGHSGPALGKLKSKEEGRQAASEQSSQRVGMPWRRENRGGDVMDEGTGRGKGGPFSKRQQKRRNQS